MKKYKLIKKYPGSDPVGTIVTGKGEDGWYSKGPGSRTYDWTQVVKYPEYWGEVVERDYEITLTRRVPYTIISVKRLSDGEVFSVGDRAMTQGSRGGHSIRQFRIKQKCNVRTPMPGIFAKDGIDRIWIDWEEGSGGNWLESTVKLKQKIFLTHDGEDIFEGDTVWYVNKERLDLDHFTTHANVTFRSDLNAYFLTKAAAESYLMNNKPCLSLKDCCEIFECISVTQGSTLMEKVKQKLGMK